MSHQKHISNLLAASTLLVPTPLSPYSQALTLAQAPPLSNTRRGVLARAANSPFGIRPTLGVASGSGEGRIGDTPTKKKKSRVQQLNVTGRDDDEGSVVGRAVGGKGIIKKKRLASSIHSVFGLASANVVVEFIELFHLQIVWDQTRHSWGNLRNHKRLGRWLLLRIELGKLRGLIIQMMTLWMRMVRSDIPASLLRGNELTSLGR